MKTLPTLIKRERLFRLAAVFFIITVLTAIVLAVENLLLSLVLAFAATYLITPFVRHLEKIGLNRNLAILIPYISLFALATAVIFIAIPLAVAQTQELRQELPKYIEGISLLLTKWESQVKGYIPEIFKYDMSDTIARLAETWLTSVIQSAPKYAQAFLTVCLLTPIFCYFLLKDGRSISRGILSLFPNNLFEMALSLSYKINAQLGDFIRARLIEAFIVGLVVWVGLAILQFPYALFLSLFAAVMNLIPYVGPFIGAVPAFVIAIINQEPSLNVLLMSMVYFIAQLVDIVFVIPLVVARTVNLHPVTVIVVFIIGANVMGVLGMIISVPVASVLKLIFYTVYDQLIKFRA
jgi:putative permease